MFCLSNLYRKIYYSKQRRLFYRGILCLYSAYAIMLIGIIIEIVIFGISINSNRPTQLSSLIFILIIVYTMLSFPLGIFLVITSFALRSKSYYLILLAFLAAPDIYFIPIIAGTIGYLITSAQGRRFSQFLTKYFVPKIQKIELYTSNSIVPKIRRVQSVMHSIIFRIKYLERRRYNKYVYPALGLSLLATGILLYYSFIIDSYSIYGYKYYYHPYFEGPGGIFNLLGIMFLIILDFALIKYLENSERAMRLINFVSTFSAVGFLSFPFILSWFIHRYNTIGFILAYDESAIFVYLALVFIQYCSRADILKKRKNDIELKSGD